MYGIHRLRAPLMALTDGGGSVHIYRKFPDWEDARHHHGDDEGPGPWALPFFGVQALSARLHQLVCTLVICTVRLQQAFSLSPRQPARECRFRRRHPTQGARVDNHSLPTLPTTTSLLPPCAMRTESGSAVNEGRDERAVCEGLHAMCVVRDPSSARFCAPALRRANCPPFSSLPGVWPGLPSP